MCRNLYSYQQVEIHIYIIPVRFQMGIEYLSDLSFYI
jgi:hypothetical protein